MQNNPKDLECSGGETSNGIFDGVDLFGNASNGRGQKGQVGVGDIDHGLEKPDAFEHGEIRGGITLAFEGVDVHGNRIGVAVLDKH